MLGLLFLSTYSLSFGKDIITLTSEMPQPNAEGRFRTFNQMGAMNGVLGEFENSIIENFKAEDWVLDVGSAYGLMCLKAAEKGCVVMAIDLDERHKQATLNRPEFQNPGLNFRYVVDDFSSPNIAESIHAAIAEADERGFDHIVLNRVLMYMTGDQVAQALKNAAALLTEGGRIYTLSTTPVMNIFASLTPEYKAKKEAGDPWPGYIQNVHAKAPNLVGKVPDAYHMIDQDTLQRVCEAAGLSFIEGPTYTGIPYQSAEILCQGQEYVTAILQRKQDSE